MSVPHTLMILGPDAGPLASFAYDGPVALPELDERIEYLGRVGVVARREIRYQEVAVVVALVVEPSRRCRPPIVELLIPTSLASPLRETTGDAGPTPGGS